jgi:hypothetical protein
MTERTVSSGVAGDAELFVSVMIQVISFSESWPALYHGLPGTVEIVIASMHAQRAERMQVKGH